MARAAILNGRLDTGTWHLPRHKQASPDRWPTADEECGKVEEADLSSGAFFIGGPLLAKVQRAVTGQGYVQHNRVGQ